jgi:L-threonylcarbamoyladenylate synthase
VIDAAAAAIESGRLAIVPTDTVYGLATTPHREEAVRGLYAAKGRQEVQPTALVARDLETLLEVVPELGGRSSAIAGALLPGPFTLVLPNPARRDPWLAGANPEAIGVRIPDLDGPGRDVLARVGVYAATSANLPGGPDPASLDDVPEELKSAVDVLVDGGVLPGTASTVLDLTGAEPRVLRDGAARAEEALRVVASLD